MLLVVRPRAPSSDALVPSSKDATRSPIELSSGPWPPSLGTTASLVRSPRAIMGRRAEPSRGQSIWLKQELALLYVLHILYTVIHHNIYIYVCVCTLFSLSSNTRFCRRMFRCRALLLVTIKLLKEVFFIAILTEVLGCARRCRVSREHTRIHGATARSGV